MKKVMLPFLKLGNHVLHEHFIRVDAVLAREICFSRQRLEVYMPLLSGRLTRWHRKRVELMESGDVAQVV